MVKELIDAVAADCLNPYYTGIHLHITSEGAKLIDVEVLILIILEYIYIVCGQELYC